ncbi:LysR family transcriptional regulator [Oleidesulfovibrio alaskensis]|jgi:DNA-binding transcriptional LysR family regulator|uniref:LysR family transcriptional regulator n=1 Tax=Oleidesulfovibrio alaskensis TaxID=58180 RepID=UPI000401E67D|nr:LysR family transcriptional regulator [Oleidesulfovibrio alaskensis]MBL3582287.1 LysR family transcriptional regulator [Oleidesulfovibrio alaskensis]
MDISSVNLNLLVALKALLDEGNVTRAAERLHITQSGMSKNLAQLRELFDDPLLVRSGNALVLTERARELEGPLEMVLGNVHALFEAQRFDPATCRRSFTLAVTDYVAQYILPDALGAILAAAPGIDIQAIGWEPDSMRALAEGKIDMATCLTEGVPASVEQLRVGEDRFACLMRAGHPLAAAGAMRLDRYVQADHAVITIGGDKVRIIDRVLGKLGHSRNIRLRVPFYASAVEIVSRTDLLLTLPAHVARNVIQARNPSEPALAWAPLPFAVDSFEYSIIWHARFHGDPGHRWVREMLFAQMQSSLFAH